MAQEPDPLSFRRILGSILLSLALLIFITQATDVRVKTRDIDTVDLRHIEPKAEASSLHELIAQKPIEKAPEPIKEVVETPPPQVQAPVEPVAPPPVATCESEIAKYNWNLPVALAVARAESGFNPLTLNDNSSTGD